MVILYSLAIKAYTVAIGISAPFQEKAKAWVRGRKNIFKKIAGDLEGRKEKRIWLHCSSLGEFEQGLPVFNALKSEYPAYKLVLTFFSPSGYEVKKNNPVADYVYYLPVDNPSNARRFISLVNPSLVIFVKNDFWHFYIRELKKRNIPLYVISARFHPSQHYFKWYGGFFEKIIRRVSHFFVQDQKSLELFYNRSMAHITVSGDTRFDRVFENYQNAKRFPSVEQFCDHNKIFIAGSTWDPDEKILLPMINSFPGFKFIFVPHEIRRQHLQLLLNRIGDDAVLYSSWDSEPHANKRVLIIDNVGMLSSLYRYGHYAYVGGAFGSGLHNILEPAAFGLPVFFGPGYKNFEEARNMIAAGGAFPVKNANELIQRTRELENDAIRYEKVKSTNTAFIEKNRGATRVIMNYIRLNFKG